MHAFDETSKDEVHYGVGHVTADYRNAERDQAIILARAQEGSGNDRDEGPHPSICSVRPPGL